MVDKPETFVANPLVLSQAAGSGLVLMEVNTGDCFELNRVGAEIWRGLSNGDTLADVITALARKYDVPAATLDADAHALLDDLLRRGLLSPAQT
jgi:hypothetical protein